VHLHERALQLCSDCCCSCYRTSAKALDQTMDGNLWSSKAEGLRIGPDLK
jgi:hypothetical protein